MSSFDATRNTFITPLKTGLDPAQVERERISAMDEVVLHVLPFPRAAELWIEQHRFYIKLNSEKSYRASIKLLTASHKHAQLRDAL